ncbi:hypothetical protein D4L85_05045 [Chryseolinea soli]|uniref:Uncharacterized protein n=1 Tax=Chryseolinea soli TaxID=2321403 RepID=A0A385SGC6_9BACT|nr:hypothetical protein D4L85_05045 [Chryseolinea soli]
MDLFASILLKAVANFIVLYHIEFLRYTGEMRYSIEFKGELFSQALHYSVKGIYNSLGYAFCFHMLF